MPVRRDNPYQQHNIKTNRQSLRLLKLVAAATGEKQYAVLERLLAAEWTRVQAQDGTTAQKGPSA